MGVPVVNIGTRQQHRESSSNVKNVDYNSESIFEAVVHQVNHGKYSSSKHLGDGEAGLKMCKILSAINLPSSQKKLYY